MIYGIEQSTDLRYPGTRIRKFSSEKAALKWKSRGGGYTHTDPDSVRNWHHTIRRVFRMPPGWRPPSRAKLRKEAKEKSTPSYPRNENDVLAAYIEGQGMEVE